MKRRTGWGEETLESISEHRDYVVKALRKKYPDTPEMADGGEGIFITWREKLERLEDLHYYETIYFWDYDFMQLELFSEEQLLASPVSEFLGIENIGLGAGNLCCLRNGWNDILVFQAERREIRCYEKFCSAKMIFMYILQENYGKEKETPAGALL